MSQSFSVVPEITHKAWLRSGQEQHPELLKKPFTGKGYDMRNAERNRKNCVLGNIRFFKRILPLEENLARVNAKILFFSKFHEFRVLIV